MRILFTTLPGASPFHPLVPLAQTLQAAGHEVAFACARSYCPTVDATGFRCFPAGFDWLAADLEPVYARVKEEVAQRATPFAPLIDVYARFLPAQMLPDLVPLLRAWAPDVLVRDPMEFAGCVAAECLGIPHAACGPYMSFCPYDGSASESEVFTRSGQVHDRRWAHAGVIFSPPWNGMSIGDTRWKRLIQQQVA